MYEPPLGLPLFVPKGDEELLESGPPKPPLFPVPAVAANGPFPPTPANNGLDPIVCPEEPLPAKVPVENGLLEPEVEKGPGPMFGPELPVAPELPVENGLPAAIPPDPLPDDPAVENGFVP